MTNQRRSRRRLKPRARRQTRPGTKPGTITIAPDAYPTTIRVMAYSKERCIEHPVEEPNELRAMLHDWPVTWVDVVGLGSESKLSALAEIFHIHPLALEDIVHVHQRAKVDPYDENLYCVIRIPDPSNEQLTEQFSIVLGKNYLVTFQERPGDAFDLIRAGIRNDHSAMRQGLKADFLAYRLIDASVDAYFPVLEAIGDHLDRLDERTEAAETHTAFAQLHGVKREVLMLRRATWPLRDALLVLRSEVTPFVCDTTRVYLRDCYDHTIQLIDLLESYREIASDVRDFYLSAISNRMNEIMKTLTVIATIFLPITFIAGVFGMNFDPDASPWNMPELRWRYGYPFSLVLMAAVAAGMLWLFRRRGWLHGDPSRVDEMADREKPLQVPRAEPTSPKR